MKKENQQPITNPQVSGLKSQPSEDVLIRVEGVSKKFCRSLKKSLWYGMQDLGSELVGKRHGGKGGLRPDEFWATSDISFELRRGECLGLIGANGAGKSTLLKMLNGLIKPDKGRIEMNGRVGALIELGAGFNPILPGRENIYINGSVLGFTKEEIDFKFDDIVEFSELGEFIDMPVQNYSSGMRVRLGFAVAAQMEPDVFIIDEVLAVGDLGFQVKCLNRIHEMLNNSAVIFVSHSMPLVSYISTHVMVMQKGKSLHPATGVSEGIDLYHQQFRGGERAVVGTGEVDIQSLSINEQAEDTIPLIPFGGSLHLSMDLAIRSSCRTLAIRLAIFSQDQRPVTEIVDEDYHLFTMGNNERSVSISAEIQSLHLASGRYSITVSVFDHEQTQSLLRMDNARFFIMGQHISTGCESFHAARWTRI